ncbi:hypothetical protein AVEN_244078-1 [Araneus ventricosus]|uniref:Uncharacterized protein n=1 Tax=Araneus ventricosus TaxID=182803 RepID=A0A4Y2K8V5_ARAVE|nr:hypothetical protein AVEN_244078-1 [Araneus ventricosus]
MGERALNQMQQVPPAFEFATRLIQNNSRPSGEESALHRRMRFENPNTTTSMLNIIIIFGESEFWAFLLLIIRSDKIKVRHGSSDIIAQGRATKILPLQQI